MSTAKAGIIVRLGNLIVLQVVFVFAALALILFVPGTDTDRRPARLYTPGARSSSMKGKQLQRYLDSLRLPGGRTSDQRDPLPGLQKRLIPCLRWIGQPWLSWPTSRFDECFTRMTAERIMTAPTLRADRTFAFIDPDCCCGCRRFWSDCPAGSDLWTKALWSTISRCRMSRLTVDRFWYVASEHGLSVSSRARTSTCRVPAVSRAPP